MTKAELTEKNDELVAEAEALEAEAPDTVRFTRAIKDAVDPNRLVNPKSLGLD